MVVTGPRAKSYLEAVRSKTAARVQAVINTHSGELYGLGGEAAVQIDVSWRGKTIKRGLQPLHLDSNHFKGWVHARVEWPAGESCAFRLAADATDDYCKQLVAEQRLVLASGRVRWIRTTRTTTSWTARP